MYYVTFMCTFTWTPYINLKVTELEIATMRMFFSFGNELDVKNCISEASRDNLQNILPQVL